MQCWLDGLWAQQYTVHMSIIALKGAKYNAVISNLQEVEAKSHNVSNPPTHNKKWPY